MAVHFSSWGARVAAKRLPGAALAEGRAKEQFAPDALEAAARLQGKEENV
ncbi:MAG: hypothetical protein GX989_02990 [Firmicutes bacterium]|nr:hypothetical protein [Bacillota bacterium]